MALPTAYRDCVGICLINGMGQVFVGQRRDQYSDAWQMPQGGIDPGETALVAARRELLEEVGSNRATLLSELDDWLYYELPEDLIGKLWGGRYRGQRQKWLLFRFDGLDSEINLDTEEPEFSAWKWSPIDRVLAEIVPFKRVIYAEVLARFQPTIDKHRTAV